MLRGRVRRGSCACKSARGVWGTGKETVSRAYLHDGRLLALDDSVEFINLVPGTRLTKGEKRDLLAFLRAL
jgi:hypothetical protein